ncbi:hypothetical protein PIB30_058918 [Stylosanthes scabra]|uniref:Uncharacterized protein n=1 Tax=Stylosanthes scabra TaxID=79078 RepID=A0ABU6TLQ7_9FABA|nr:hypothetical protein [Stylosanthes scabra]
MAEVEAMGFHSLQHILEWIVNQEIYTYLASKFDLDNNVIKDDVANIEINAEIVERALRLPSCEILQTIVLCRVTKNPEKKEKKAKRKASNLLEEEVTQTKRKASNLVEEEVTHGEDEPISEITSHLTQETTPEDTTIGDNAVDQIPSLVPQSPAATPPALCSGNENNNDGSLPPEAIIEQDFHSFFHSLYSSVDVCVDDGFLYSEFLNSLLAGEDHQATFDSP